jgi:hypothetical protein
MENYEGFKLFFKAVELWINQEIDIENARFGQAEICGATRRLAQATSRANHFWKFSAVREELGL